MYEWNQNNGEEFACKERNPNMPSRSVDIYTIFGTWLIFFSEGEGQIKKKKINKIIILHNSLKNICINYWYNYGWKIKVYQNRSIQTVTLVYDTKMGHRFIVL